MSKQIIFVDANVENYQTLLEGINPNSQIIILDAKSDGIKQIGQTLENHTGISAIHIVSHGSAGSLELGSASLNSSSLNTYASELQQWQQYLTEGADILLYGCNVGQGTLGTAFVEELAALTGADVAASDNITGSAAKGGDWNLEIETGSIEAAIAIDSQTLAAYDSVLPTYTATDFSSLVNAINNANSSPGVDIIDITSNITFTAGAAGVTPLLLPIINSDITFVGNGNVINANNNRLFFISGSGITVNFANLNITGARGQGGAGGGYGGGGAAGMGGALFVDRGTVNLSSVTFSNNNAVGGAGVGFAGDSAGGGGGFGGNGGSGSSNTGGGGGGFGGSGGNGVSGSSGVGGSAGSYSGAIGGQGGFNSTGSAGGIFAGGGAGEGTSGSWNGGAGGFGGGGGAGSNTGTGGIGGFGGGGGRGQGAAGGQFGGVGGSGSVAGGGGAGLGGAVFVRSGTVNLFNTTFNNNSVTGGASGGGDAGVGQAKGGAIFIASSTTQSGGLTVPTVNAINGTPTYSGNIAANQAGTTTDNSNVYGTINSTTSTTPTVSSIALVGPSSTNASSVDYTVTFSQAVTGLRTTDFALAATGITGATITALTGSGTTYTLTVNTGTGSGTLGLNFIDNNSVLNNSAVPIGGIGVQNFTGSVYTVRSAPTVSNITSTLADNTYSVGQVIPITVTFSQSVNVTGTPQLTLNNGGTATYTSGTGSNTLNFSYTVAAGQNTADLDYASTAALSLNGGTINDAANNNATLTLPAPGAASSLGANKNIVIDATAPTATSFTPANNATNIAGGANLVLQFNEAIQKGTGNILIKKVSDNSVVETIDVTGANVSVTGSSLTVNPTLDLVDSTPYYVEIAVAAIKDLAGNNYAGISGNSTWNFTTVDTTAPAAPTITSISTDSGTPNDGITNDATLVLTGTAEANSTVNLFNNGASIGSINADASGNWTFDYTGTTLTDGTYNFTATATDTANNTSSSSAPFSVTVDTTAPTVTINQDAGQPDPTAGSTVNFAVVFSEAVTGFDGSDITLGGTAGATTATVTAVGGDGKTYNVAITGMTGPGTVSATVNANAATDVAGNSSAPSTSTDNQVNYDNSIPTVTSITRTDADPNNAGTVNYAVTFSENVTGVDTSDFTLAPGSIADAGITNVTGTGNTYTVTVNTGTGDGTVQLNLNDDDSIINSLSVPLGGVGSGNGNSSGQIYTIDKTGVSVTNITSTLPDGNYTVGQIIPITVTFGEAVNVTGTPQLSLNNGGSAGYVTGTGTNTLTFNYTVGTGESATDLDALSLLLAGGTIKDLVGNDATLTLPAAGAASSLGSNKNIAIDTTAAGITSLNSSQADGSYSVGTIIPITVTFDKVVNVSGTPEVTLNSGGVATYSGGNGTNTLTFNYTVAAGQSASDLEVTALNLAGGTIQDTAGNDATLTLPVAGSPLSLGGTKNIAVDTAVPTVTLASTAATTVNAPFNVSATFSETVTGFTATDISVTNGTVSNLTGTGANYNFTVTPTANGTVTVNVPASRATDIAGNNNTAATSLTRTADITAPTVTLASTAATTVNAPFNVSATFSETVTGFTATDISVTNGTVSNLTGTGANYNFTVTPTANGTVTVNVPASRATDAAGNNNTAAVALTRSFDRTAPTVTLASTAASTVNAPFNVTATFSETVTGFIASDLSVTNGTVSNFTGSGANYSFTVTPTANGTVTVNVPASRATDAAGNNNTSAVALTQTFDNSIPTITSVTSTAPNTSDEDENKYTADAVIPITVNFSEAVNVTGKPEMTLNSGGKAIYASGSGTNTLTFNYKVGVGEASSDLDYSIADFTNPFKPISVLSLAGGTIKDGANNNASLTLPAFGTKSSLGGSKNITIVAGFYSWSQLDAYLKKFYETNPLNPNVKLPLQAAFTAFEINEANPASTLTATGTFEADKIELIPTANSWSIPLGSVVNGLKGYGSSFDNQISKLVPSLDISGLSIGIPIPSLTITDLRSAPIYEFSKEITVPDRGPVFGLIKNTLGINKLTLKAGLNTALVGGGPYVAANLEAKKTLVDIGGFRINFLGGELSAGVNNTLMGTLEATVSLQPKLQLTNYDPFQSNEPNLNLTGLLTFGVTTSNETSFTGGFKVEAENSKNPAVWKNPFGLPNSEFRNASLELKGDTKSIGEVLVSADFRYQNFDLTLTGLAVDAKTGVPKTLVLTANKPVNLFDVWAMQQQLAFSPASLLLQNLKPVQDAMDFLRNIIDVNIVSVDSDKDGKKDPLLKLVPESITIGGKQIQPGFAINGEVNVWGKKATLMLEANPFNINPNAKGSLTLPAIDLGFLKLKGYSNDIDRNAETLNLNFNLSPNDVSMAASAQLEVFNEKIAGINAIVKGNNISIKDFKLGWNSILALDLDYLNMDIKGGTGSAKGKVKLFGEELLGAKIIVEDNKLKISGKIGYDLPIIGNVGADLTIRSDGTLSGSEVGVSFSGGLLGSFKYNLKFENINSLDDVFEQAANKALDLATGLVNDAIDGVVKGFNTLTSSVVNGFNKVGDYLKGIGYEIWDWFDGNSSSGNDGNNEIYGNNSDNWLYGHRGNDKIVGQGGYDRIYGGPDGDWLYGMNESDYLYGESGDDELHGNSGNDELYGGDNTDVLFGEEEWDKLYGNSGNDRLHGGPGNDALYGGIDQDYLYGDDDDDDLRGENGYDFLSGGNGKDTLYGGADEDSLWGDAGNDSLNGEDGNDILHGSHGQDTLKGGNGKDVLYGQQGHDLLEGGDGDDVLYGQDDGKQGQTYDATWNNDTLKGEGGKDNLFGGLGNDYLLGGNGNDAIDGGAGNDSLSGEAGNDLLNGGNDNDTLEGGSGNDTLYGRDGNDSLKGNENEDFLEGGTGDDNLSGETGNDLLDGGNNNDTIEGGSGNDTLYGQDGNDLLKGNENDDLLNGGKGNDSLYGGGNNDTLSGGNGNNVLDGGDGSDTADYRFSTSSVNASLTSKKATFSSNTDSLSGIDNIIGSALNDTLIGDDWVNGNILSGEAGNDFLDGQQANDTLNGGEGDDSLLGGDGNDYLNPGTGKDSIDGGLGNDTLRLVGKKEDYQFTETPTGWRIVAANGDVKTVTGIENFDYQFGYASSTITSLTIDQVRKYYKSRVIDGYIGTGKIFFDANLNGTLDENEPFTITNADGSFDLNVDIENFDTNQNGELDYTEGKFVLMGGMDILSGVDAATGLLMATPLTSTLNSTVVTPLTTIIAELVQQGTDPATAEASVKAALGLPAGVDLSSYDPLEAITKGDNQGVSVFGSMIMVQNTIVQMAKFLEGVSEKEVAQLAFSGISAIANQTKSSTPIDLAKAETIQAILQATITQEAQSDPKINATELAASAAAAAQIMALGNQMVAELISSGRPATDITTEITKLQAVSVGQVAVGLSDLAAGTVSVEQFLANNTKEAILSRMATVQVNDPTVRPEVKPIEISDPDTGNPDTGNPDTGNPDNGNPDTNPTPALPFPRVEDTTTGTPTPTPGDDNLTYGAGDDTVVALPGNDTILSGDGNDLLFGNTGNDLLNGQGGNDFIYGGKDQDTLTGELGNDTLCGDIGDDSLTGNDGDDALYGNQGNDLLDGGLGNDTLRGGKENDSLLGADGNDVLCGDIGDDSLLGDTGNDMLFGNQGNDFLDGGTGDNTLRGGKENDTLVGNQGLDLLCGDIGNDSLSAGAGNDMLFGNSGQDILDGGDGDDTLHGGQGDDSLIGGTGNDLLDGDFGNDILTGGVGNDRFVLELGVGGDIISDFKVGEDSLVLAGGLSFQQLTITAENNATLIRLGDELLATLNGIESSLLNQQSFTLI